MKEYSVANTEKKHKKPKKVETTDIEEYLKHTYELKMEKRLKHMLEEQGERKTKKREQDGSSEDSRV